MQKVHKGVAGDKGWCVHDCRKACGHESKETLWRRGGRVQARLDSHVGSEVTACPHTRYVREGGWQSTVPGERGKRSD
jgi:hypothetical protein